MPPEAPTAPTSEQLLAGVAQYPAVLRELRSIAEGQRAIQNALGALQKPSKDDGWADAREASKYMGLSFTTFNKLRYEAKPRLNGSKVGGKTYYKKTDLDTYMRLYEIKSKGIA